MEETKFIVKRIKITSDDYEAVTVKVTDFKNKIPQGFTWDKHEITCSDNYLFVIVHLKKLSS